MAQFASLHGLKETVAALRACLSYDPETGVFSWIKTRRGVNKGGVAGCLNAHGYVQIWVDGRNYYGHRLAWLFVHGEWPKCTVDHINGNRADNRIANLRDVSRGVNVENQRRAARNSTSGLLGVSFCKERDRWSAGIQVRRRRKHLGRFATAEEAHQAYVAAKRTMHAGCTI